SWWLVHEHLRPHPCGHGVVTVDQRLHPVGHRTARATEQPKELNEVRSLLGGDLLLDESFKIVCGHLTSESSACRLLKLRPHPGARLPLGEQKEHQSICTCHPLTDARRPVGSCKNGSNEVCNRPPLNCGKSRLHGTQFDLPIVHQNALLTVSKV